MGGSSIRSDKLGAKNKSNSTKPSIRKTGYQGSTDTLGWKGIQPGDPASIPGYNKQLAKTVQGHSQNRN